MSSSTPGMDVPVSKVDHNATLPSTRPAAKAKVPETLLKQSTSTSWNTKNLGLRVATDFTSGFLAAGMVAPLITVIDKAIMQNASGQNSLKNSLKASAISFITRPHSLLFSKPFALVCMLYGGTYFTANSVDTATSTVKNKPASLVTSGTTKFAASSTANVGICLFKDQAFARLFGPGGPPRPVPLPSYVLFTLRDCMTIFASFNVPPLLGPVIQRSMGAEMQKAVSGQTIAQFAAPASIQLLSTPMHLLGLDFYNRGGSTVSWADRWAIVRKNWLVTSGARMCRIVPAFGVGGVVNANVRKNLMARLE